MASSSSSQAKIKEKKHREKKPHKEGKKCKAGK
jgi:hypothetical protein